MNALIDELIGLFGNIIHKIDDKRSEKANFVFKKFNEYLVRLEKRYLELKAIESEKKKMETETNRPLSEIQLDFVDKTEAFHQHLYATLSAFILLMSHITDKGVASQLPIGSVQKFLDNRYQNSKYSSALQDQIIVLKKSVEFRSIYIDHPQQHIAHDWMTYTYENGNVIIYFIPKSGKVSYRECPIDPYSPEFIPPVDTDQFYVSPNPDETLYALSYFVKKEMGGIKL